MIGHDDDDDDEGEAVNLAGPAAPCQTSTLHPEPGGPHRIIGLSEKNMNFEYSSNLSTF